MATLREQLILDLEKAGTGRGDVSTDAVTLTSPTCGDRVSVEIDHDGAVIRAITWTGHGCTVSMASASALAAVAPGLGLDEFAVAKDAFAASVHGPVPTDDELSVDALLGDAVAFAGIGRLPLRARCASLAWEAAAQALVL